MTTGSYVDDDIVINKKGLNFKTCMYKVDGLFCGAMAAHKLPMPRGIPDMPLCYKHYRDMDGWTLDDTNYILEEMLGEEDDSI